MVWICAIGPISGRAVRCKTHITDLARALSDLPAWIRLHYVYPYPHVDELIPLMAEGLILPYLDMPLQHGSERVLRAMRRPAATEKVLDRLARWRATCPELVLRSTFIVGFPGETEAEFEQLAGVSARRPTGPGRLFSLFAGGGRRRQ